MTCAISGKQDQAWYSAPLRVRRKTAETQPPPKVTGKHPQSQYTGPVFYSTKEAQWAPVPRKANAVLWGWTCLLVLPGVPEGPLISWKPPACPHNLPTLQPPRMPTVGPHSSPHAFGPHTGLIITWSTEGWLSESKNSSEAIPPARYSRKTSSVFWRSRQEQALYCDFPRPLSTIHKTIFSVADILRVIPEYQLGITSMEVYFFSLQVKGGS